MAIVIMGVSGCGKSTVAQGLAERLGRDYIDADDMHTYCAREKMRQGIALSDVDRIPWLYRLRDLLVLNPTAVLACSALTYRYRDILRSSEKPLWFVHLIISFTDALERLTARTGHFFPATLLGSQYEIVEPLRDSEWGVVLPAMQPVTVLEDTIIAALSSILHSDTSESNP